MTDNLKAVLAFIICDIKFTTITETKDGKWRHNFKTVPRRYTIIPACVLMTPIIVFLYGIKDVSKLFRDSLKENSWSSYNIIKADKTNPSKWECYKKF
jgi:hypothetical protein